MRFRSESPHLSGAFSAAILKVASPNFNSSIKSKHSYTLCYHKINFMRENDVFTEYTKRMNQSMHKYGLYTVDIATLTKVLEKKISEIITNPGKTRFDILESIAKIFGLTYFQFGNPEFPLPKHNQLPELTKKRIIFRREKGPPMLKELVEPINYKKLHLNKFIVMILNKYKLSDKFTASEVFNKLPEEIKNSLDSFSKITDRFSGSLSKYVTKTEDTLKTKGKRGPAQIYYRLTQKIPKEVIEEAQKIIKG